ncbi:MAG: beta-galactosidase [Candidatus Pacebacteria bacterium]|nr:beta-galactosidase [Candidatus Paceibacterota bacterium]
MSVDVCDYGLVIDGELVPAISGEFHYWRVPYSNWDTILSVIEEMGIRVVSTYISWHSHEIEEGRYDFTGRTKAELNLVEFLQKLRDRGLWCIIRPGPYIYAEEINGGPPDHAACYYRGSKTFHDKAIPYIEAVCKVIKPFLHGQGGPIVLLQPDNEINPWHFWYWRQLGLDGGDGPFQMYLKETYSHSEALNEKWGTTFTSFDQAKAITSANGWNRKTLLAYRDFVAFLHWESHRLGHWNVEQYRSHGIDVPFFHNLLAFFEVHDWHSLRNQTHFAGVDIYPEAEFSGGSGGDSVFAADVGTHQHFVDVCRAASDLGGLSHIAEFQSGYTVDNYKGNLTPNHYRMMFVSAIGSGIRGWNWFMLVDREHWCAGCITEGGNTNPNCFNEFKQMIRLVEEHGLHRTRRLCSVGVLYDPLKMASTGEPWESDIRKALYSDGIDYRRIDARNENVLAELSTLIYAGSNDLDTEHQRRLKTWVEDGGTLIVFGEGIFYDANLQPSNILGFTPAERKIELWGYENGFEITVGDEKVVLSQPCWEFQDCIDGGMVGKLIPVEIHYAMVQLDAVRNLKFTCGYQRSVGKGRVIVFGALPKAGSMAAVLRGLNVELPIRVTHGETYAGALIRDDGRQFVCIVNTSRHSKLVRCETSAQSWAQMFTDIYTGTTFTARDGEVTVTIEGRTGIILENA